MKILKIIIGVLLLLGLLGSIVNFMDDVSDYESVDTIGHLITMIIIGGLAYLCLKPTTKKKNL